MYVWFLKHITAIIKNKHDKVRNKNVRITLPKSTTTK